MSSLRTRIKHRLFQVVNKIILVEKKRIVRLKGIALYPSEIHLLLVIRDEIDTNATLIAKQLGVTKGAVSQTLTRLEKKGIVKKTKDPSNKNELSVALTDFGRAAYHRCRGAQTALMAAHDSYLAPLAPEEKQVILRFLDHMESAIDGLNQD